MILTATNQTFNDLKTEVDFYFKQLLKIDNDQKLSSKITSEEKLFLKIMKSNFILMLYNLVESVFVSGMQEVYDHINQETLTYSELSNQLQRTLIDYHLMSIYQQKTNIKTQIKSFHKILDKITSNQTFHLYKGMFSGGGNFNSKIINNICLQHGIVIHTADNNNQLEKIRLNRNKLAHGVESFSNCMRDTTIADLEFTKNETLSFMKTIIDEMESYCFSKSYMHS